MKYSRITTYYPEEPKISGRCVLKYNTYVIIIKLENHVE